MAVLTRNCATAAGHGARTGSAASRTPGGRTNLPLKGFAQCQLWCEIVALACDLVARAQLLALADEARRCEPTRLRLRIFAVACRLASSDHHLRLRLAERWSFAADITAAIARLQALPAD